MSNNTEKQQSNEVTRSMAYLNFWQAFTYRKATAKKITV